MKTYFSVPNVLTKKRLCSSKPGRPGKAGRLHIRTVWRFRQCNYAQKTILCASPVHFCAQNELINTHCCSCCKSCNVLHNSVFPDLTGLVATYISLFGCANFCFHPDLAGPERRSDCASGRFFFCFFFFLSFFFFKFRFFSHKVEKRVFRGSFEPR